MTRPWTAVMAVCCVPTPTRAAEKTVTLREALRTADARNLSLAATRTELAAGGTP